MPVCRIRKFVAVHAFTIMTGVLHAADSDLKIDRAVIFSSGVAYFDYGAEVTDDAVGRLNLRTDQINDVLKSLVVRDLNGGVISVVNYASQDPMERTLKSFRVDLTDKPSLSQILDRLRGESVEVTGPRTAKGLIVGVDVRRSLPDEKNLLIEAQFLNVLTPAGMVQVPLADVENLKFTNEQINNELQNALTTLAAGASTDKKSVELHFDGKGKRTVQVGYLVEAPIWKTSYRLVEDDKGKLLLQGWANIDNATEEDWKDVKLSLVSGRPISFRMDLYTPLFVPRPLEQLDLHASLRAPDFEGAMALNDLGYAGADAKEDVVPASPARRGREAGAKDKTVSGGQSYGFERSNAAAAFGLRMEAGGVSLGEALTTTTAAVAVGEEAGELFEYRIETPVTIPRKQSAMLPIVSSPIQGDKVSIFNADSHPKHPFHGYHLTNTSKLFLMQGPITVFEDETYAGDAKLPDLKPDEKRLIAYALDLGMEVDVKRPAHPQEIVSIKIAKGTLIHSDRYIDEREYLIKNKDAKDRTLLIEQTYDDNWKLMKPKEPFERTASLSRFKVAVPANKTVSETVTLEQTVAQTLILSNLDDASIEYYCRAKVISPAVKEALQKLISMKAELGRVSADRQRAESDLNSWTAEQARVRENLKTLEKNTDPYKRQLTKFDEIETSIEKTRTRLTDLKNQEAAKQQELNTWLLGLELE